MDNNSKATPSASHVTIAQLMLPEHANYLGNVHGGWIMKLVDEVGALACMRHSHHRVVTVAIDQMTFSQPIRIGDLVTLDAEVTYVGSTSMEVEVLVSAENPITRNHTHTNKAYLVYVALDDNQKPVKVPELVVTTPEEKARMEAAIIRQKHRLRNR
ncbi:acyl-CoA thioesterase [Chloroflexota bacterium]